MISSKTEFSRVRPILGTYFKITLNHSPTDELQKTLSEALVEAERLEKIFSRFDQDSDLNQLNNSALGQPILYAPELFHLLKLTLEIWRDSNFSFHPFYPRNLTSDPLQFLSNFHIIKNIDIKIDLNGIAKGYIVDLIASKLENLGFSGHVNAGGDLKFFNTITKNLSFRIGAPESPLLREIEIQYNSVATSVPRQTHNLRPTLSTKHSLS